MKDSLSLRVQAYVQASRLARQPAYDFGPIETYDAHDPVEVASDIEQIEFGEVEELEVREAYKQRKRDAEKAERAREKRVAYMKENAESIELAKKRRIALRETLDSNPLSKAELASLRQRAKKAMLAASKRASEPVIFCCGAIRPVSYECPLNRDHGPEVLEVNSW